MPDIKITVIIISFFIFSFIILAGGEDSIPEKWNTLCPKICTCHDSHFSEIPLISLIQSDKKNFDFIVKEEAVERGTYKEKNEALDEADENLNHFQEENPFVKVAVCIIRNENELTDAFLNLELIEALTLLQSSGIENITLRGNHFKEMKNLKVLEIHGLSQEKFAQNNVKVGKLYLKYDVLSTLDSLQYVNLQNIQLLGSPNLGNKIPPISAYDYMNSKLEPNQILPMIQPDYDQKLQKDSKMKLKLISKNLVFLTPNDAEDEVVPYNIYKEEQQRAGSYSFAGLNNLKYLRVHQCNLSEVNWEMFDGLTNLEILSLEGNNLLFIPEFAFYGAPNLKSLSLAHNNLLAVQMMSLAGLFQLEHLDLSYNNISHLSDFSFPPFPKLKTADLTNNPLEIIFPGTFEIMNATQQLHLGSSNTVLDIQPNSFSGLDSLIKLNLNNIDLEILERELLRGMPQLRLLKISGKIKSIAFDAFLDSPKLEKLVLRNCSIEKLSMDSFYGLYDLRILDISHNLLSSLPPGLFDQQFSLKDLFIQNNNLTMLPGGFFANVPAKMIRLDGNPWHCTCAMKDWKPSVINQIKQKTHNSSMCQFRFDKGSMCSLSANEEYIYDKKVEPRCLTPKKFKGWGVFHLLHKELRCDKKLKLLKINRKAYLAQKLLDYENISQYSKKFYHKKSHHSDNDNFHNNSKLNVSFNDNRKNYTSDNLIEQTNVTFLPARKYVGTTNLDKEVIGKESTPQNGSTLASEVNVTVNGSNIEKLESVGDATENDRKYLDSGAANSNVQNDLKILNNPIKEQKINKKEKEKLRILKEKEERLKDKEKIRNAEKFDPSKLKKIMQTELDNKRKEKLKLLNKNV